MSDESDNAQRIVVHAFPVVTFDMSDLWTPIAELDDKYATNLLLCAPELVDLDCNEAGIGMGYYQDDGLTWHMTQKECGALDRTKDYGTFMACQWSMTNDEWCHVPCTPTHFMRMKGPAK